MARPSLDDLREGTILLAQIRANQNRENIVEAGSRAGLDFDLAVSSALSAAYKLGRGHETRHRETGENLTDPFETAPGDD